MLQYRTRCRTHKGFFDGFEVTGIAFVFEFGFPVRVCFVHVFGDVDFVGFDGQGFFAVEDRALAGLLSLRQLAVRAFGVERRYDDVGDVASVAALVTVHRLRSMAIVT